MAEDGGRHCCSEMTYHAEYVCDHPIHAGDPLACPDRLIYRARGGGYGILIHDGGSSFVSIVHCPWCGKKLPDRGTMRRIDLDALSE
jgi:hypothetical protein